MRYTIKFSLILVIVLLMGLWVSSCGKDTGVVTVYTSMPEDIMQVVKEKFEEKYAEMRVEIWRESSSKLSSRIEVEAESPQGVEADIIWAAAPSYYFNWIDLGMIQSYDSPEGKKVGKNFKDTQQRYFGARLISVVIVYNKDLLDPEEVPQTWTELLDPKWNGKIVIADARRSGTALAWVDAITNEYGWEFLESFSNNNIAIEPKNSAVVDKVVSGDYPIGISLDYEARNRIKQGVSIGIVYPQDGAVIIPSPLAITTTTENLEGARTFVDYVLSQEGQEILVKQGSFIPARNDVAFPFNVKQNVTETDISVNWTRVYENEIQLKRNYKRILLD